VPKQQVFSKLKKKNLKTGRRGYLGCLYSMYQKHELLAKIELLNPLLCQEAIITIAIVNCQSDLHGSTESLKTSKTALSKMRSF